MTDQGRPVSTRTHPGAHDQLVPERAAVRHDGAHSAGAPDGEGHHARALAGRNTDVGDPLTARLRSTAACRLRLGDPSHAKSKPPSPRAISEPRCLRLKQPVTRAEAGRLTKWNSARTSLLRGPCELLQRYQSRYDIEADLCELLVGQAFVKGAKRHVLPREQPNGSPVRASLLDVIEDDANTSRSATND